MVVEAVDTAEGKCMLVDALLQAGHTVISASSLAVWGGPTMLQRRMGRLVLVGDMVRGVGPGQPVLAPRVVMAAALEADAVIEQLLGHNALKPRFQPMNQHELCKISVAMSRAANTRSALPQYFS